MASRAFDRLQEGYFSQWLERHPVAANYAGVASGEGKLGETGIAFEKREEDQRRKTLRQLSRIPPTELSNEQQIERLALRSLLLEESEEFSRSRHSRDPSAIDHVLGVLQHELQRSEEEPERARRNLQSVLEAAPGYLRSAGRMIQRPVPAWREIMKQSAGSAGSLLRAIETFLGANCKAGNGASSEDKRKLQRVLRAIHQYRDTAMARPMDHSKAFALGAAGLQRRIHDSLGLDYSLAEIESLAWAEVERIRYSMQMVSKRLGRGKCVEEMVEEGRAAWMPPSNLLELYRSETQRLAKAFERADAVEFPKADRLEIRLVPAFMRHLFPLAAYSAPGPFERKQRGVFWVNDLSVTRTSEEEKQAERRQHFGLALTCVHEAYPGHHLQFVRSNRHPRKWRRMYAHAIFFEGWTLWCEHMLVDLGIEKDPRTQLQQLHDALWRCHRILVDLKLQTGVYTWRQAVNHLCRYLGFTRARAEADVNWYTGAAGVPMSYWLGRLENERLRRRLVDGRGWSLRKFNDWLLSFGTIPQAWIEKYGLD